MESLLLVFLAWEYDEESLIAKLPRDILLNELVILSPHYFVILDNTKEWVGPPWEECWRAERYLKDWWDGYGSIIENPWPIVKPPEKNTENLSMHVVLKRLEYATKIKNAIQKTKKE